MSPDGAAHEELERLLQFLYQCPLGLLELDAAGTVTMINPAAVNLLAPAFDDLDPTDFFPLLARLAPELVELVQGDPDTLGPLAQGRRVLVPAGPAGEHCVELLLVRVEPGRLMVALVDVSEERRMATREHEIIVELQRSLLGRIDAVPGLPVGLTYRVADVERQVGGDWYDLVDLPDDRVGLVVGDVVGHNLAAAAAMGQLRSAVRSLAMDHADPGALLERADRFADTIEDAACTTVTYAVLDRVSGRLRYASAGHPPVLVLRTDGSADYLWGGRERPLACLDPVPRSAAETVLAAGDTLVMFTDGLVERRGARIDEGLAHLRDTALGLRHLPADDLCRELVARLLEPGRADDDVCVLVVRHVPVRRIDVRGPAPAVLTLPRARGVHVP